MTGLVVRLARRPRGPLEPSDLRVEPAAAPVPADGEALVRNLWMSVDPSTRLRCSDWAPPNMGRIELGQVLDGWAVGRVIASRAPELAEGALVLHPHGWRELCVVDARAAGRARPFVLPAGESIPPQAYLDVLGWSGLAAYAGLLHVGELRDGDVVFVSAAAGAVGSLVVQIAKLSGHTVVASAGSPEKLAVARELGADAAFSYRGADVGALLAEHAPDGIDLYFDNVGGEQLEAALAALRHGGRVALCGAVSRYDDANPPRGPANLFHAVAKALTLRGFLARHHAGLMDRFRDDMREWLSAGSIRRHETVVDGLEEAPAALGALLRGESLGKMLVRLRS